jgi:hypothetical protein
MVNAVMPFALARTWNRTTILVVDVPVCPCGLQTAGKVGVES